MHGHRCGTTIVWENTRKCNNYVFCLTYPFLTNISSVCRSSIFPATTAAVDPSVGLWQLTRATRALVQAFISCRLDYCNSLLGPGRGCRRPSEAPTVSSEIGSSFGVWSPESAVTTTSQRFFNTSLVASSWPGDIQDGGPGVEVTARSSSVLPGWLVTYSSCLSWRSLLAAALSYIWDPRRPTHQNFMDI